MNILITTQKVDLQDDILGFMHGWILEFSKNFEKVTVICLFEGEHDLPDNVEVLTLGKNCQNQKSKIKNLKILLRLKYVVNFYKYIWQKRKGYDVVFVHMNSEYMVLGAWLWKLLNKKRGLWFAHYRPNWIAKMAFRLTDVIFTSTRKACAFASDKVRVVGQGIDVDRFAPADKNKEGDKIEILFLGRISPIKKIEMLIVAMAEIKKTDLYLNIIGAPGESEPERDGAYWESLNQQVEEANLNECVNFQGKVPYCEIVQYYQNSDIFVNLTPTGSLDKTTLEAMACGNVILVSNRAYYEILPKQLHALLIFEENNQVDLNDKLRGLTTLDLDERRKIGEELRRIVVQGHGVGGLIKRIKGIYENG